MGAAIAIVAIFGLLAFAGAGGGSKGGFRMDSQCKQATLTDLSKMIESMTAFGQSDGWFENPTTDRQEISDRAAGYFASLFPQCAGKHPETLKGTDGSVITWDAWLDMGIPTPEGAAASVSPLRVAAQKVAGR